ncbi:ATP-dependent helicase, partial [Streptococcus pneumoniae]|nr:ATP-dependent helicase [Streptococcus pneumoniae]
ECLVELINDDAKILFVAPKEVLGEETISLDYFDGVCVEYTEWYSMSITEQNKVRISHDHVLIVAEKMFSTYPKLCDILIDIA